MGSRAKRKQKDDDRDSTALLLLRPLLSFAMRKRGEAGGTQRTREVCEVRQSSQFFKVICSLSSLFGKDKKVRLSSKHRHEAFAEASHTCLVALCRVHDPSLPSLHRMRSLPCGFAKQATGAGCCIETLEERGSSDGRLLPSLCVPPQQHDPGPLTTPRNEDMPSTSAVYLSDGRLARTCDFRPFSSAGNKAGHVGGFQRVFLD